MFYRLFIVLAFVATVGMLHGQTGDTVESSDTAWTTGGSVGMDLSQLVLLNPKIGAGENRLAIGGITNLFANFKEGKTIWASDGSLQLAVQRIGSSDVPFTKNMDVLRLNSKYGHQLKEKWYMGVLAGFESLLLSTYDDLTLSSQNGNSLQAKLFSPATFLVAPGFDYVHSDKLSVFLSPFAYKSIIVLDDDIAALGVHGNPWNSSSDFENIKHELGANVKAKYKNVFYEKLGISSELNLFYDYLSDEHGAEFVDVIWINDFGYELFKGLSLNILLDLRWDRDLASVLPSDQLSDGLNEFRKWMITETFVIKYNYVFK